MLAILINLEKSAQYLFCVGSTVREMALSTPRKSQSDQANWKRVLETRKCLDKCWSEDIDWTLYPETLKNVSAGNARYYGVIIMY